MFEFGDIPLQFVYLESCHYNSFPFSYLPFYTYLILLDIFLDPVIFVWTKIPCHCCSLRSLTSGTYTSSCSFSFLLSSHCLPLPSHSSLAWSRGAAILAGGGAASAPLEHMHHVGLRLCLGSRCHHRSKAERHHPCCMDLNVCI